MGADNLDLLIFDMDGTLLDSRVDITISVNHVRRIRHGLPPLSEEQVVEYINRKERNLPLLFYGTPEAETEDRELFRTHYLQQCTKNLRTFSGVPETLRRLREMRIPMAVATNASTIFARRMIEAAGIGQYFFCIAGADTTGRSKPDPSMIHYILRELGKENATDFRGGLVGDSVKDMDAARNAGMEAIFAAWGYGREADGTRILHTFEDLLELIHNDKNPLPPEGKGIRCD